MEQCIAMSQKTSLQKIDSSHVNPIDSGLASFEFFKNNWDKHDLVTERSTKVLFLDDRNIPLWYGEVNGLQKIPLDNNNEYPEIDADEVMKEASKKHASKIVLASNSPFHLREDNEKTDEILKQFQDTADDYSVCLEDFIILSPYGYFSYKENNFKKSPILTI